MAAEKPLCDRPNLKEVLAEIPATPGVYIMKDRKGEVIYIGKALSLRSRVRSYFNAAGDARPSVEFLRRRIFEIETVVTDNEKSAFLLENTLIKKHLPRYNVRLRDDKTYLGLRLSVQDEVPRLSTARRAAKDGAEYFGPFYSSSMLYEVRRLLQKLFGVRVCNDTFFRNRTRPCIEHQIGRCLAPCIAGMVSAEEYGRAVEDTRRFLRGHGEEVLRRLKGLMEAASESDNFEAAIRYRDQMTAVSETLDRQVVVSHRRDDDWDVVGLYLEAGFAELCVLLVREGQVVGTKNYALGQVIGEPDETLTEVLMQRYCRDEQVAPPGEILLPFEPHAKTLLEEALAAVHPENKRPELFIPQRGEKKQLVEMAQQNAQVNFSTARRAQERLTENLAELAKKLHLPRVPERIECFDISNFHGRQAVGSMVVFIDGKADKKFYRHFKIRTVEGSNDFQMLYEVLSRRFNPKNKAPEPRPDLLIVDGGKGQLSMAVKVIEELGVTDVALAGMAKSRVMPNDQGRSEERLFLPGRLNPVVFRRGSGALFLLERIRDEAHRFAITHHRKLRHKSALRSALENIPGIGKERARNLLELFGSVERIAQASAEEIQTAGLSEALALAVKQALALPSSP